MVTHCEESRGRGRLGGEASARVPFASFLGRYCCKPWSGSCVSTRTAGSVTRRLSGFGCARACRPAIARPRIPRTRRAGAGSQSPRQTRGILFQAGPHARVRFRSERPVIATAVNDQSQSCRRVIRSPPRFQDRCVDCASNGEPIKDQWSANSSGHPCDLPEIGHSIFRLCGGPNLRSHRRMNHPLLASFSSHVHDRPDKTMGFIR